MGKNDVSFILSFVILMAKMWIFGFSPGVCPTEPSNLVSSFECLVSNGRWALLEGIRLGGSATKTHIGGKCTFNFPLFGNWRQPTSAFIRMKEFKAFKPQNLWGAPPKCMHEFEFQWWSSIHHLHTSRQKLPINFTIRGVRQLYVNKYISVKRYAIWHVISNNK